MRKLASIQRITALEPIPNADRIEKAKVLGWEVVVEKGRYQPGDLVVYVEVDSVLPSDNPEFAFMASSNYRVRTVRLRGQISQGICFPLSILPPGNWQEGDEVTEVLGIKKYEPPTTYAMAGNAKGAFPGFLIKTDETRIQSVPWILDFFYSRPAYITEKLDGTSFTAYIRDGEFGVCSRNQELKPEPLTVYWKYALDHRLQDRLLGLGGNYAIQGELVGPGIQKNYLKLPTLELYIFQVFDIDRYVYLDFQDALAIVKWLDLKFVPVICSFNLTHWPSVQDLVNLAEKGMSAVNPDVDWEGIVVRTVREEYIDGFGRASFKVLNNRYLLKHGG